MRVIGRAWRRWLAIPLAAALLLAIAVPLWINREPAPVYASGVAASSVTTTGQDTVNDFTFVQFDIDWNNSWRDLVNWDAVWVFVKYNVGGGDWKHATLSTTAGNHSVTTNNGVAATIAPASDGKGVFMHRTDVGNGAINWDGVKLRWNYGTDAVADDALVTVKVFAIEMVHIPQGEFDLGDGDGTNESTFAFHGADNTKVHISTTLVGGIKVDVNAFDDAQLEGAGIGIDGDGGLDTDNNGTVDNANFPTGYNAFYLMKTDMPQGQYAEFLNTLTATQASARFPGQTTSRHYIEVQAGVYGTDANGNNVLNEAADGEWVAMGHTYWVDVAAYADWAGLRPYTELEYEKAARGTVAAVFGEYPWGNTNITGADYTLSIPGQAGEAIATNYATGSVGNALNAVTVGTIGGPMRVGIFATATSTRIEAGASYYGVLDMAGNQWEFVVFVGDSTGRAFAGSHGDGVLSANGNATNSDWPGYVSAEVTGLAGHGLRGGAFGDPVDRGLTSDRAIAGFQSTTRSAPFGIRFARTAP